MKITDFKNEEAIDLLADIIEPTALILGDPETRRVFMAVKDGKTTKVKAISQVLKNHSSEIVEILARLEGKEPEEYTCNILALPQKILEILNDKDLADFFKSQVQMMESESSLPAMESIEEHEK